MTRVLLAEDDTSISEPLSRALRREGYQVEVTEDGPTTLGRALSDGVDLILLDIGLPELDGLEVCRRVRAEGNGVPVLILTARADEVDTVVGLDAGADDYVTKPVGIDELLARLRAVLRRAAPSGEPVVELGELVVDLAKREVRMAGRSVHLTPHQFDLLRVLALNAGKLLTQRQLLQEVWGPGYTDAANLLQVNVSQLRRKIEPDRAHPRYLLTETGAGYRLVEPT